MSIVSQSVANDKMQAAIKLLDSLHQLVVKAVDGGCPAHEMERQLWSGVLDMGHQLLELYFQLLGPGDEGEEIERDGQRLKRSSELERRSYLSVFGKLEIERWTLTD